MGRADFRDGAEAIGGALAVFAVVMLFVLSACAGISPRIDDATGTTLAERCTGYRADIAAYEALTVGLGHEPSQAELAAYLVAKSFVASRCPALPLTGVSPGMTLLEPP